MAVATVAPYVRKMTESNRSLRHELDDAIEKVRRELVILQAPSSIGNPPDNGSVIADLEAELKACLAPLMSNVK